MFNHVDDTMDLIGLTVEMLAATRPKKTEKYIVSEQDERQVTSPFTTSNHSHTPEETLVEN